MGEGGKFFNTHLPRKLKLGGGEFKHNLRLSFLKITQKSRKGMNLVIVPYHFARAQFFFSAFLLIFKGGVEFRGGGCYFKA